MDCRLNKKAYGKPAPSQVQTLDTPLRTFLVLFCSFFSLCSFLLTQLDIVAVWWQGEEIEMSCFICSFNVACWRHWDELYNPSNTYFLERATIKIDNDLFLFVCFHNISVFVYFSFFITSSSRFFLSLKKKTAKKKKKANLLLESTLHLIYCLVQINHHQSKGSDFNWLFSFSRFFFLYSFYLYNQYLMETGLIISFNYHYLEL